MIALGTVLDQTLPIQIVAVSVVAILATIGVYGIVALLVRMDDFGFKLIDMAESEKSFLYAFGDLLVISLPKVIRVLTFVGTLAMLLVSGGIFSHNVHVVHDLFHFLPAIVMDLFIGLVVGYIALLSQKIYKKFKA